jgi:hypothetical protein
MVGPERAELAAAMGASSVVMGRVLDQDRQRPGDVPWPQVHDEPLLADPKDARTRTPGGATGWPGCCAAGSAGVGSSRAGRTTGSSTGAVTGIPAPARRTPPGRGTCTSARTASCPTCPPWSSAWPTRKEPPGAEGAAPGGEPMSQRQSATQRRSVPAFQADHPHLRSAVGNPPGRQCRSHNSHHRSRKLTPKRAPRPRTEERRDRRHRPHRARTRSSNRRVTLLDAESSVPCGSR